MIRTFLRSKIHRATVTAAHVDYVGSITLDPKLLEAAHLAPFEQVDVLNISNGARLTTYAIEGRRGSGDCALNGAAALLCSPGDIVLVLAYAQLQAGEEMKHKPSLVQVDAKNRVKRIKRSERPHSFK
jgi:aspartate 1-decarboxylase